VPAEQCHAKRPEYLSGAPAAIGGPASNIVTARSMPVGNGGLTRARARTRPAGPDARRSPFVLLRHPGRRGTRRSRRSAGVQ
jgi:hypothetical protein